MTVSNSKSDTPKRAELRERIGLAVFGGRTLPVNWETDSRIPRVEALVEQEIAKAKIDELVDMHRNIMDNPKWRSDAPDQAFAYGRVHRIIDERIDQLKGEGSYDSIKQ